MSSEKSQNTAYFRSSWKMFTREKGWIKLTILLSLTMLVPIAGLFGIVGYSLEWARCTAWGADAAPKQHGVEVGKCMISGVRAAVILLGYSIVASIPFAILSAVFPGNFSPRSVDTIGFIVSSVRDLLISVVSLIAALNATIYQRVGAGFDIKHIYSMISSDLRGLVGIIGVQAICIPCFSTFLALYIFQTVGLVLLSPYLSVLVPFAFQFAPVVGSLVLFELALILLLVVSALLLVVNINAVGLWMRQFAVASWGPPFSSADVSQEQDESPVLPLPEDIQSSEVSGVSAPPDSSSSPGSPVPPDSSSLPVPPDSPPFPGSPVPPDLPSSPGSPVPPDSSSLPVPPDSPSSPAPPDPPDSPPSPAPPDSPDSLPSPAPPVPPQDSPAPPVPPQDSPAPSAEAAQSQGAAPSTDVEPDGDAQVGDSTGATGETSVGHGAEENDKKMQN